MKRALVIFKGWASTDSLYRKFEGIFDAEIIFSSEIPHKELNEFDEIIAIGWSMGTLDCIRFVRENSIKKAVLISPTLKFTKTTRPLIIKKMLKRLKIERAGCLRDFIELTFNDLSKFEEYLGEYFEEILKIHDDELVAGLNKLLDDEVDAETSGLSPLIITGSYDKVIPVENSEEVLKVFPNAVFKKIHGGHNLIFEAWDEVKNCIEDYIQMAP